MIEGSPIEGIRPTPDNHKYFLHQWSLTDLDIEITKCINVFEDHNQPIYTAIITDGVQTSAGPPFLLFTFTLKKQQTEWIHIYILFFLSAKILLRNMSLYRKSNNFIPNSFLKETRSFSRLIKMNIRHSIIEFSSIDQRNFALSDVPIASITMDVHFSEFVSLPFDQFVINHEIIDGLFYLAWARAIHVKYPYKGICYKFTSILRNIF